MARKILVALAVIAVVILGGVGTYHHPAEVTDFVTDLAKDWVKTGVGLALWALVGWAVWVLRDRYLYEGWRVVVTDRTQTTAESVVPPAVVKQWIAADFGDWGPNGWRDITGTLVRRPACGPVNVDAEMARVLGVLVIDRER